MNRRIVPAIGVVIIGIYLLGIGFPASAAPSFQQTLAPSPTAGPDGRIIYIVQDGDSPWLISAKFGIDYNELLALNGWGSNEVLQPGQQVLLGLGGPVDATLAPAATLEPTLSGPTPTPGIGGATVCILLYEDVNGDAFRQDTEGPIGAGAVSMSELTGLFSESRSTLNEYDDAGEPLYVCFVDIPEGNYNVSVAIPEGYNPTTGMDASFTVSIGDKTTLNFGAQLSAAAAAADLPVEEGGRSPLMGFLGVLLLFTGIGLGIYSTRMGKK
ncbi:MAG: LysM peptidoglycan-binding domain-containing protein [Chloroflexota bacterium]